ncbi:MAG: protein kinase [Candidatus Eisenbacteria bacterium]|nr:protein kinase [Candidatus Eisenbacteria bacterium]
MPIQPGTKLGAYEVLSPLGAGGMGEVWRARDTRLGRDVAIKVIPEDVAADPERITRFEREARLLASLRHPNVATLHGLESDGAQRFIVMECVEGESLAQRLASGPLPVAEAIELCRQVATGLEAAHESGIVHRDLKPANIMVTPGGEVRLLDFGLARGDLASSGAVSDYSHSPTLTGGLTGANVILGTAAYMSPEQARGKPVDRRTDIWSFGAVLYECLAGRQCFAGETLSDTIAMILQSDPDWTALPRATPRRVRELLARCLERDPRKRLRDAGEARIALERALAEPAGEEGAPARSARGRTLAFGALVLVAGALLGAGAMRFAGREAARVVRYPVPPPPGDVIGVDGFTAAAYWDVPASGDRIAARLTTPNRDRKGPDLFVRRLSEADWRVVPGGERVMDAPLFGDDGRTLWFVSRISDDSPEERVMKANTDDGSPAVSVCDVPAGMGMMAPLSGGRVLFIHGDGERIALYDPAAGGLSGWKVVERGKYAGTISSFVPPSMAGAGRDEVFVGTTDYATDGWHQGTAVLDVRTGRLSPVMRDGQYAHLTGDGVLLFSRGSSILATRYDARAHATRGDAVPLFEGVRTRGQWLPGHFALTARGDLFYSPGGAVGERRTLERLGLDGRFTPLPIAPRAFGNAPGVALDGRRLAISVTNARGFDEIWAFEPGDSLGQRILRVEGADVTRPVFTHDGEWMAYNQSVDQYGSGLFVRRYGAEEAALKVVVVRGDSVVRAVKWFPDGRHLLFRGGARGNERLFIAEVAPASGGASRVRAVLPAWQVGETDLSPDGRLLAFDTRRTGNQQVLGCTISPDGATGLPVVLVRSGAIPAWSADGRRLWYVAGPTSAEAWEMQVSSAGGITPGPARRLFTLGPEGFRIVSGLQLPDGTVVCALDPVEGPELARVDVVQGWWSTVRSKLRR